MSTYFSHQLTKKYIVIVGSLFDDYRILKDGKFIKIPVSYGGKSKIIERYNRRDVSFKGVQMTLPRIGFEFSGFYYDKERKLNRLHQFVGTSTESSVNALYTPVPYNINITTSIIGNKNNDVVQIAEQIIPKFTPDLKITSNLVPENNVNLDISLCLNSIYIEDGYEGLITDDRLITYTMNFTLKAYYFREITDKKIILEETVNFYDFDEPDTIIFSDTITANTI